jgi:phosphoenolpyruvate carboxykinase (ATP)
VRAIVNGKLIDANYEKLPGFNLEIPTSVPDVDSKLLNPRNAWLDVNEHDKNARLLMEQFIENFKRFDVDDKIRQAGPVL